MSESNPSDLKEVVQLAEKRFNEINPIGLNFGAEVTFAMQILQDKPALMKVASGCPRSLVAALNNAAAIGISLNPAKKECYLLSRGVKTGQKTDRGKDIWEQRIYLEPSYIGLNNVATNTGSIDWVQADVVRKNDKFIKRGVGEKPSHEHEPFATHEERGPIVGSYCVAKAGDDYLTTTLNKERLDSIRARSETWKKSIANGGNGAGPWLTDEEEMDMKAVMRNAFKTWPKTDKFARLEQAVHLSNENEGFAPIESETEEPGTPAKLPAYPEDRFEKMFPDIEKAIKAGQKTAAAMISTMKTKYTLSPAQIKQIEDCEAIEGEVIQADPGNNCIVCHKPLTKGACLNCGASQTEKNNEAS